jgi:3-oxoadipate enol-lactonase
MPYAESNGIKLYYERQGEGDDLVLIAGLGANAGMWLAQRPAFARHFRVTVFDNRGAGRSDAPDEPYSIQQMAEDTAGLMKAVGIRRAHVLGLSMGGVIAQALALNHAPIVDRLVLACSRARAATTRRLWGEAIAECTRMGVDPTALSLLRMPWMMTSEFMRDERRVLAQLEAISNDPYPMQPSAYLRQHVASIDVDLMDRLHRIESPSLVLVGAEDIVNPVSESEILAQKIPGATLRVLPRGGHGFYREFSEDFNAAVLEFLLAR